MIIKIISQLFVIIIEDGLIIGNENQNESCMAILHEMRFRNNIVTCFQTTPE